HRRKCNKTEASSSGPRAQASWATRRRRPCRTEPSGQAEPLGFTNCSRYAFTAGLRRPRVFFLLTFFFFFLFFPTCPFVPAPAVKCSFNNCASRYPASAACL